MILRGSFQLLPGVGATREANLWANGYRDWADLAEALRAGTPLRLLMGRPDVVARAKKTTGPLDERARAWLAALDEVEAAFDSPDMLGWFCERLPPKEHWRLLAPRIQEGLYLDIETSGRGFHRDVITVLGVLYQGRFRQWIWPEDMREVNELVREAPFVGSFNGRGFDIPYLQAKLPGFPEPRAHIDLLPLTRRAGIKGGLKGVERWYDLRRDDDVDGLCGADAITLWDRYQRGDEAALDQLLRYNRADVEMLPLVAEHLCRDLHPEGGEDADPTLVPTRLVAAEAAPRRRFWLEERLAELAAEGEEPPVVVAVLGSSWARWKAKRCWSSRFLRPEDAARLTEAARPDVVVLAPEHAGLAERLAATGARVEVREPESWRESLPVGDDEARVELGNLGLGDHRWRRDEEVRAVALALGTLPG